MSKSKDITPKNEKGQAHGLCMYHFKDGRLKEIVEFVDGRHHGKYIWFHHCGSPFIVANFVNDDLYGLKLSYKQNGNLKTKEYYIT